MRVEKAPNTSRLYEAIQQGNTALLGTIYIGQLEIRATQGRNSKGYFILLESTNPKYSERLGSLEELADKGEFEKRFKKFLCNALGCNEKELEKYLGIEKEEIIISILDSFDLVQSMNPLIIQQQIPPSYNDEKKD